MQVFNQWGSRQAAVLSLHSSIQSDRPVSTVHHLCNQATLQMLHVLDNMPDGTATYVIKLCHALKQAELLIATRCADVDLFYPGDCAYLNDNSVPVS